MNPIDVDTILNELPDGADLWTIKERGTGKYLIVPDPRYPGRRPARFFLSRDDAQDFLTEVLDVNEALRKADIFPEPVKARPALQSIAAGFENADAFVLHSPNEVREFIRERS